MAYTTLTRYLKLKVDSDLSADAVYNLQRIDALASTFVIDATEKLKIQSKGNIEIEPNDTALGGTGTGGAVEIGTSNHKNVLFQAFTSVFKVDCGLSLKNVAADKSNYLKFSFNDSSTAAEKSLDWKLSGNGDARSLEVSHDGVVVTAAAAQILTSKTINADSNNISNIDDGNIKAGAAIAYSKLALTGSVVNADLVAGIDAAKVADGSVSNAKFQTLNGVTSSIQTQLDGKAGNGANSDITSLSGLTTALSVAQGGTGNDGSDKAVALFGLLPDQAGNSNKVLGLNSGATGLEWKTFAAGGTVEAVNAPLTLSGDGKTVGIPVATASANGYLAQGDWGTFNSKEPPITAGTNGQYWRGDKSWQTLDKSAVGLSNVDNTSDVNKPISSATQTALNAKYDASNPSSFVDANGARSAAVISGTPNWSETTQAPTANAVSTYVLANSGPKVTATWSSSVGTETIAVSHTFGTDPVSVTIYDANGKTVWIDEEDRNSNSVSLTRTTGVAPGDWTVVIKKL